MKRYFFICITPELSIIKKQINYKSNFVQNAHNYVSHRMFQSDLETCEMHNSFRNKKDILYIILCNFLTFIFIETL